MEGIKKFFYDCFHNACDHKSYVTNGVIAFFIVLSIATIPVYYLAEDENIIDGLNLFHRIELTFFSVEYLLRAWTAHKTSKYIFSWEGLVDLISILPFLIAHIWYFEVPYTLIPLRALRVLKFMYFDEVHHKTCAIIKKYDPHFHFQPGESLIYIAKKSHVLFALCSFEPIAICSISLLVLVFLGTGTIALAIVGVGLLLALFSFLRCWFDHHFDVIYITTHRVIMQDKALFGMSNNIINYQSITNVIPDNKGIINWLLRCGTVYVETSSAQDTHGFHYVRDPHYVVMLINEYRARATENPTKGS